jgi:hypothetical protein
MPSETYTVVEQDRPKSGEEPDLEALMEEIYRRLRYRLSLEREWRGI